MIGVIEHNNLRVAMLQKNRREQLMSRNDPDLQMAIEPYFNKLADMTSAEEIKDFLVSEEIKAVPAKRNACAIAVYVQDRSGEPNVEVSYGSTSCKNDARNVWLPHTTAMMLFVKNFDDGNYPELELS
jgi:hypothetical protein